MPTILYYCQHLSGVGHYVRSYEIARSLSQSFTVYWVEGGKYVPRPLCKELNVIYIPPITRDNGGNIVGLHGDVGIESIFSKRLNILLDFVKNNHIDLLIIEYYPFSKWELSIELEPLICAVRSNKGLVICSIRDIIHQTRFENKPNNEYIKTVIYKLNSNFDAVLVHSDPNFIRLQESFKSIEKIKVPIYYTGIVSEKFNQSSFISSQQFNLSTFNIPYVVVSAGGSNGGMELITSVIDLWQDHAISQNRLLVICSMHTRQIKNLLSKKAIYKESKNTIKVLPFREDFLEILSRCSLSISQCGYNTAANIIETGVNAIIHPHQLMSDQHDRSLALERKGLAFYCRDLKLLGSTIINMNDNSHSKHDLNINGAETSRSIVEKIIGLNI